MQLACNCAFSRWISILIPPFPVHAPHNSCTRHHLFHHLGPHQPTLSSECCFCFTCCLAYKNKNKFSEICMLCIFVIIYILPRAALLTDIKKYFQKYVHYYCVTFSLFLMFINHSWQVELLFQANNVHKTNLKKK